MRARLRRAFAGLRALVRRRRADHDLDDELRDYLERSTDRKIAEGLDLDEARRLARAELGSRAAIHDRVNEVGWESAVGTIWQDIRYGARLMRRSPGFTAVAVLVLAIGIGINTALFSVINAMFFARPLVKAPEELAYFYRLIMDRPNPVSNDEFRVLTSAGSDLAEFTSHSPISMNVSIDGETITTRGELVDSRYFGLLGVPPILGRGFADSEDDPATTELAIVISHDLWIRRFRADPSVLSREVRLGRAGRSFSSRQFKVVGVTGAGFHGLSDPWSPSRFWITATQFDGRRSRTAGWPILRLKPGVTFEQLRGFLDATTIAIKDEYRRGGFAIRMAPEALERLSHRADRVVDIRMPFDPEATLIPTGMLSALFITVGLVLVIATANIAGLLLARGMTRSGEVAVRRALGAGSGRLVRQLLTEALLLSLAGGAVGVAVAWNLVAVFIATMPPAFAVDVRLDWRVLGFAVAVCLATGALMGLVPAMQATRVRILEMLGNGLPGSRDVRARVRHWVVIPQVGLCLVLLVVAGVHVRALYRIEAANLGYATEGATVLNVARWTPENWLQTAGEVPAEQQARVFEENATRTRAFIRASVSAACETPGVTACGLVDALPLSLRSGIVLPDRRVVTRDATTSITVPDVRVATGGYFDAMKIQLVAGRTFDARDVPGSKPVAIVSEDVAGRLWPNRHPIGQFIAFEDPSPARRLNAPEWLEVIGVVSEVAPVMGRRGDRPLVYLPEQQIRTAHVLIAFQLGNPALVVRGQTDHPAVVQRVKSAVLGADPFAEISSVRSIEQLIGEILYPRRVAAGVLTAAGTIGLVLAAIGLYGVMSYSVAQRRREIGIRAALGANRADLVRLVLREGARVIVIGGTMGIVMGIAAVRLTAGLIPGLPLIDMLSFVGVPVVLAIVILGACYLPARGAANVSPIEVLRSS